MIKLFEMFAGYGTATFALKELGIKHKLVGFSEIDKFASQVFEMNHGSKNYGDATKINPEELPDFNLLTAGFPCQSFSVAGKNLGELDTRGTLFHEVIRIAEVKKPRFILLENVKGLTNKTHRPTFEKILSELDRIGYFVSWKILNSKDFGVPQNRKRVWIVCFRESEDWEKFDFPQPQELKIFLKDILEDEVDEKYYLSKKALSNPKFKIGDKFKEEINKEYISSCLTALMYKGYGNDGRKVVRESKNYIIHNCLTEAIGRSGSSSEYIDSLKKVTLARIEKNKIIQLNKPKHSNNRIYFPEGISPTLNTMGGGNRQPFIVEPKEMYNNIVSVAIRNKNRSKHQQLGVPYGTFPKQYHLVFNKDFGVSYAVKSASQEFMTTTKDYRIRKLIPIECFRLQGFLRDQIKLEGISDTQKYKLAGNGQTLQVVMAIFKEML